MRVDVFASYNHVVDRCVRGRVAIVIDTLRFTSTCITALANGCSQVVPVEEVEEAMKVEHTMRDSVCLKGGERQADKIPGFELGNSPYEYAGDVVSGKVIIITTSNGTRAVRKAKNAELILIGALLNASAVAKKAFTEGGDVAIICSGTRTKYSSDDVLTAGAIINKMRAYMPKNEYLELDDLGQAAEALYLKYRNDIKKGLKDSYHYNFLVEKGYINDIDFCLQTDMTDIVPVYIDGIIYAR